MLDFAVEKPLPQILREYIATVAHIAPETITHVFLALHTEGQHGAGAIPEYECEYKGYARVPVPVDDDGWECDGKFLRYKGALSFNECQSGLQYVTHISLLDTESGPATIVADGQLCVPLLISKGMTLVVRIDFPNLGA